MRVEPAKNNQADKKEASNFKTEKSPFDSSGHAKAVEIANAPTSGAFAKILDEARHQSGKEKEKFSAEKTDSAESAAKTKETEEEKETERRTEQKNELEEKNDSRGESDAEQNDEENATAFKANVLPSDTKSSVEINAPAARAILHVADLERIVSFVRTEKFADAQQILIALKHSVLDGLQIKLTLQENGNFKAEFLALNEQIKKQLKKRERELLDILRQRSAKFSAIDILTS